MQQDIQINAMPKFRQHFVEAMAIPCKTAVYANLMNVVTLPPIKEIFTLDDGGGERRKRRRG
jgi:uncharacterized 2Fe-2S/4Fe-4S cluster protein (DUF4445 family)